MDQFEIVENNLEIIKSCGDLFDVICKKEGVLPRKEEDAILNLNLFLFSRIAYLTALGWEKIGSILAPVEKVRKAGQQIRDILGVNIDIICFKYREKLLSILYEDDTLDSDKYIDNLRKILDFAELHDIPEVLLRKDDIVAFFGNIDLKYGEPDTLQRLLYLGLDLPEGVDEDLLSFTRENLRKFIQILKKSNSYKDIVTDLSENIKDLVVKKAIQDFLLNGDKEKLKEIVEKRLTLYINSEGVYKDKTGKVFESVEINGEYVRVLTSNVKGETIDNTVRTLYDYLEAADLKDLRKKIENAYDNKEVLAMAALYLILIDSKKFKAKKQGENISFYDKIYQQYKLKKSKKIKKIWGIYPKVSKYKDNLRRYLQAFIVTFLAAIIILLTGFTFDYVWNILFKNPIDPYRSFIEDVIKLYQISFDLEKQMVGDCLDSVRNNYLSYSSTISSSTGDADSEKRDDIAVGFVQPIDMDASLPRYFATGYASKAEYQKGEIEYNVVQPKVAFEEIQNVEPLFKVTYDISRKDLKKLVDNNKINLLQMLYPLEEDYVLTSITVRDLMNKDKLLVIDYVRANSLENGITAKEKELLLKMWRPEIICTYGISKDIQNSFVTSAERKSYSSLDNSTIKKVITKGLELNDDATIEEILEAIKNKTYSTTPIKDAGLTDKIKDMREKEYLETVASLDSLICNLAATLAVEVDDDLIYVMGYMDNGDGFLTLNEQHAWTISENGEIIDVTPTISKENEEITNLNKETLGETNKNESSNINLAISKYANKEISDVTEMILKWGLGNKIPLLAILTLLGVIVYKLDGKKIVFTLKLKNVEKLLNKDNMDEAYAKIKEVLYGGINIPRKLETEDFVLLIRKEALSLSKEDLTNLKKQLLLMKKEDKKLINNSLKLVSEIPFIVDNAEEIKRVLEKK